jgi:hypothetical protein
LLAVRRGVVDDGMIDSVVTRKLSLRLEGDGIDTRLGVR